MMRVERFHVPDSPLEGRVVPSDWNRLDLGGKREALLRCGIARSYAQAARMMGKHAAAVKRYRAELRSAMTE